MPKKADLDPIQAGLAEELREETEPAKKTRKRTKKTDANTAENVPNAEGKVSVKCEESQENTEKKKERKYYVQKIPNDEVRKKAALEYIEKKTRPHPSPKANGHFPNSDEALKMAPGDNARYVAFGMMIYNMSPIDINNAEQVEQRIQEYFALCMQHDMKPGVANLAMALGVTRNRLLDIVNDAESRSNVPPDTRAFIKKAHAYMGSYWEQIMQNGKINPASGIFLGKNNFGYKDQTEHVLTPNTRLTDNIAPADLQRRIEALPDD